MKATCILSTFVVSTMTLAAFGGSARAQTCNSGGPCVSISQSGGGPGLYAISSASTSADVESWSGKGLVAVSVDNIGAWVRSSHHDAIDASTSVSGRSAVFAHNEATNGGYGVFATAQGTGHAVHGYATSSSGWAGYFEGKVFTTASYQSSDVRLKKDIKEAPYGLNTLLDLHPVTFKWKKDGAEPAAQLGLIAQEVQKVVPEVVAPTGTDGMLSVNYVALLPIVIKGVQEQQQIVREQRARIQKQEDRITALERARGPAMSSILSGDLGHGTTLGLFAVAASVLLRRRNRNAA